MSTRWRAIGIITGTLIIGVAIGALVVGPLIARQHFKRVADWRTPRGFAERFEQIIEPDADQVGPLRAVLARYGESFDDLASRHREEAAEMIDSLSAEIDTILTDEQKERLEQKRRRLRPPGEPPGHHGRPRPR
jgi:hypothetical protein